MLNKVTGFLIISLGVTIGCFSLYVDYLDGQIKEKDTALKSAQQSIATIKRVNTDLNDTIKSLSQNLEDERKALVEMKNYNATVDAKLKNAVDALKGLLQNEENDCGSQRLSDDVLKRMWQHYSNSNADS